MAAVHVLEIQTGKYKGRRVKLSDPEVTVGRGEDSRVRISSSEVSRDHCILVPQANGVLVRDLDSRNGTFVDGRPISGEKLLEPGGTLTIGPMTFLLLGGHPSKSPSSAEVAILGKQGSTDKLSDDEIASWLSDDEIPTSLLGSDTTVIKGPGAPASAAAGGGTPAVTVSAPVKKKEFKSVAEEAQDIIRRHFEMVAQEESAEETSEES